MPTLRQIIPALCLATAISATALSVSAVYADSTAAPPDAAATDASAAPSPSGAAGWRHGAHGGGALGGMGYVLHKLNLTADQKAQIKSIMASQKSQFEALRENSKANRQALANTPPSSDPQSKYQALIQTAQSNASTRIALMSSTWTQIYTNVLTQAQRDQIPSIVAAAEGARQSRMEEWKAEHSTSP